ncbi:thioesterase family protein [Nocardia carnea]|uniref:thioesterase family protein n=1 Tax=Nocardia carnea TaxID=37328 RepID=UPI0024573E53|nr:thioesterase family protein [Nocardia carnea]
MGRGIPTAQQIREIPAALSAAVTAHEIDDNGHMNVVHYLDLSSQGADVLMRELGVNESYRAQRRLGVFTAEHHLVYYSELRERDPFTVHVRVLERSDKAIHLMTFLVDDKRDVLSNTLEIMLVHVDLDKRRASPVPDNLAAALDRKVAAGNALTWPAPVCGSLRIRR